MKIRLGNDIRLKVSLATYTDDDRIMFFRYISKPDSENTQNFFLGEVINVSFVEDHLYSKEELVKMLGRTAEMLIQDVQFNKGDIISFISESKSINNFEETSYNFEVTYERIKSLQHIINARAFFVNNTLKEKIEKEYIKKNRFIGRFPIEPFVDEFQPTAHNINNIGFPKYRAFVHNEYKGFGVHPDWKRCFPFGDVNITIYESKIEYKGNNSEDIIVTFPAYAQKYPGEYSLIVIGEVYDEGYSCNKRTITVNRNNIFELVKDTDEQDLDKPVMIEINNVENQTEQKDIYVVAGKYDNDAIHLNRTDPGVVDIDISPISGWYVEGE